MIALDEYIKNENKFKDYYKIRHLYFNFNKLDKKIETFKVYDEKSKNLRSKCNDLCGNIVALLNNKSKFDNDKKTIFHLDKKSKFYENKSKSLFNKINHTLDKLYNLPISFEENNSNLSLKNENLDFETFLKSITKNQCTITLNKFFKQNKNKVLQEESLPILFISENVISILTTLTNTFDEILLFTKNNSNSLKLISVKNLKQSSQIEYDIISNNNHYNLSLENQFFTRKFNLKYKDKSSDVTKFPIQITLTINNCKNIK